MAGQPAWARFGTLQGVIMAGSGDNSPGPGRPAFPLANEPYAERGARAVAAAAQHGPGVVAEVAQAVGSGAPEVGRTFVLGGNAILTLQGSESRYTFRVQQGKPREGDQPDRSQPYFLQLLTGPDNTADYQYVGIVDQSSGRCTPHACEPDDCHERAGCGLGLGYVADVRRQGVRAGQGPSCRAVWALWSIADGPGSIETGFGPECSAKLGI